MLSNAFDTSKNTAEVNILAKPVCGQSLKFSKKGPHSSFANKLVLVSE